MLLQIDKHNPSFSLFPINNTRTAWKPFGLPIILAVPHSDDSNGRLVNVKISIKDVPNTIKVSGHDNIGLLYQDSEIYSKTVDKVQLNSRLINVENYQIIQDNNITYFQYTTSTKVTASIEYIVNTTYYDLSDILIETETLQNNRYYISYQAQHYQRVTSKDYLNELICVNSNNIAISELKLEINHPGEILYQFYKLTPQPYFTNSTKSQDTTVEFYRPFTDLLQDIFDEQNLLASINWVNKSPPEVIPYLSSLLGWDIPYFPESLDRLRQAVIKQTVRLQSLSGSRRSIISLFKLFGFDILISNLWWSSDGKRLIRPGEILPQHYQDDQITIQEQYQIDLVLNSYNKNGFSVISTNLLHRPQTAETDNDYTTISDNGDITVEAYLVNPQSQAYTTLLNISQQIGNNPSSYAKNNQCYIDSNGFINCESISSLTNGIETVGFCQILLSGKMALPQQILKVGKSPISEHTIKFDRLTNILHFTINEYIKDNVVFAFVYYKKQDIMVPEHLKTMQSNRFDIQVLTQENKQQVDSTTLEFAIEFLDRLKSFHSLLNVIRTKLENNETYEVTGWCVGGDYAMRYDTDAGKLQVPPAIIPDLSNINNNCALLDPQSIGYKSSDILLRLRKLSNLEEEYQAWKKLDGRNNVPSNFLQLKQNEPNGDICQYTAYGQDKIMSNGSVINSVEYSPKPNSAQSSYNLSLTPVTIMTNGQYNGNKSSNSDYGHYSTFQLQSDTTPDSAHPTDGYDFCYKGRVIDNVLYNLDNIMTESFRPRACVYGLGYGVYYSFPSLAETVLHGTAKPIYNSSTNRTIFSGGAITNNYHYTDSIQTKYMTDFDTMTNSYMGSLYRSYSKPMTRTIHYNDRIGINTIDQRHNLALMRPSLQIEKPTLHLPGCRFATLNKLQHDIIHDEYTARPWDDEYSTICDINDKPSYLNAKIVTINDEQFLQFDDVILTIRGNSLKPDIPSLGDQSGIINSSDIIHSVYMSDCVSEYVLLDQVCEYDTNVSDGLIDVNDPLFSSHDNCNTTTKDYADGYKCEYGYFEYEQVNYDQWYDVLQLLGFPFYNSTGTLILFRLSSGIRNLHEINFRLDCGCLNVCGTAQCNISKYYDNGHFDFESDKISMNAIMPIDEVLTAQFLLLDGSVQSLLETVS